MLRPSQATSAWQAPALLEKGKKDETGGTLTGDSCGGAGDRDRVALAVNETCLGDDTNLNGDCVGTREADTLTAGDDNDHHTWLAWKATTS